MSQQASAATTAPDTTAPPASDSSTSVADTSNNMHKIFTIPEILEEILMKLPAEDVIARCRLVNRTFKAAASSFYTLRRLPDLTVPASGNIRAYNSLLINTAFEFPSGGLVNYTPNPNLPPFTFQTVPLPGNQSGMEPPCAHFINIIVNSQKEALELRQRTHTESWARFGIAGVACTDIAITFRCVPNGEEMQHPDPSTSLGWSRDDFKRGVDCEKKKTQWTTAKTMALGWRLRELMGHAARVVLNCDQAWTGCEDGEEELGLAEAMEESKEYRKRLAELHRESRKHVGTHFGDPEDKAAGREAPMLRARSMLEGTGEYQKVLYPR